MLVPSQIYEDKTNILPLGLSHSVSFVRVVISTLLMNLRIQKRYRANLVGMIIETFLIIAVFGLFATTLEFKGNGFDSFTSYQIFIFFMGAIIVIAFNSTALSVPVQTVQRDLYNGTLEYLYFNPISHYGYFIGNILSDALIKFSIIFFPAFILLYYLSGASFLSMVAVFGVGILILITLMSFGILISLSAILWKEVTGITGLIGLLFEFLGGAFFPIQTFPEPIQWLAFLLPYTFGYDLIRYFSFEGVWTPLLPIGLEIGILLIYAIFYLLLSIFLLKRVERHAKTKGLHLI